MTGASSRSGPGGLMVGITALGVALGAAPAEAGIVVLKSGATVVGRIDPAEVTAAEVVVRFPYGARTDVGELRLARDTIRWFDAAADAPTDEYWTAFADAELEARWSQAREAFRARRPAGPDDATIVYRDGRRVTGVLESYAAGVYRLRVGQGTLQVPARDVARVELAPAGPSGRVTLDVREVRLEDVARAIGSQADREVVVDPAVAAIPVTLRRVDVPWAAVLEEVAVLAGCRVELSDGRLLLVARGAPRSVPTVEVDVEANDLDLRVVVERIARLARVNVLVEPAVQEKVTVSLRQLPWRDALDLVARLARCRVEERERGLLVLTQPPRVTLQFTDAEVRTVLQLLAAYSGKDLVLDADVAGTVTIDVQDVAWDVALLSICRSRGLFARAVGEVVVVSAKDSTEGEPLRVPSSEGGPRAPGAPPTDRPPAPAAAPAPAPVPADEPRRAPPPPAVRQPGTGQAPPSPGPSRLPPGVSPGARAGEWVHERTGVALVWVPPGAFRMGSDDPAHQRPGRTAHDVRLTRGFFLGKHELTWGQYRAFCGATGRAAPPAPGEGFETTDQHPVVNVTWVDAQAYCAWAGVRLPTEAEWERAARGEDGRAYPWGDEEPDATRCDLDQVHDDPRGALPVGSFPAGASPFGALDMAGSVWEWVQDRFDAYSAAAQVDPTGPDAGEDVGELRVVRGGDRGPQRPCQTFDRNDLDTRSRHCGLRVALSAP